MDIKYKAMKSATFLFNTSMHILVKENYLFSKILILKLSLLWFQRFFNHKTFETKKEIEKTTQFFPI